jgi:intracellular sulfur oxidation DsrE/DsrF family protein
MKTPNALASRRTFFERFSKIIASVAVLPQLISSSSTVASPRPINPRLNDAEDWFKGIKGKHRMVYDATTIHEGFSIVWSWVFLDSNNETGTPDEEVTTLVVLRQGAFALALNNEIWSSYKLGKNLKISDPATNVPATTNPYWDPPKGIMPENGMSIKSLMERGVMFCVCDRALTVNSTMVARTKNLDSEQVKKEWVDGLFPGIQIVPSGVWAVNRAQENGCTYCFAG